jgi:hypothetical protein
MVQPGLRGFQAGPGVALSGRLKSSTKRMLVGGMLAPVGMKVAVTLRA